MHASVKDTGTLSVDSVSIYASEAGQEQVWMTANKPRHKLFPQKLCGESNRRFCATYFDLFKWLHWEDDNESVYCLYLATMFVS